MYLFSNSSRETLPLKKCQPHKTLPRQCRGAAEGTALTLLTHEACRVGDVGADFAIYFDEPLHADLLDLISCQSILQPVAQKDDERKALPQLMWAC